LPEKNRKDLLDVPKKALADLNIVFVSHMDEVLKVALLPKPIKPKKEKKEKKAEKPAEKPGEKTAPISSAKTGPDESKPPVHPGV